MILQASSSELSASLSRPTFASVDRREVGVGDKDELQRHAAFLEDLGLQKELDAFTQQFGTQ